MNLIKSVNIESAYTLLTSLFLMFRIDLNHKFNIQSKIVLLLVISSCEQVPNITQKESKITKPSIVNASYEVNTTPAKHGMFTRPIQSQGKVEARSFIPIVFEVSGIIESVWIENATYVKHGDLIASLNNDLQKIELEEATVDYERARVKYENKLAAFGDSANYPLNWQRIKEKTALLVGLPHAQVALKKARFNLDRTEFKAPFSGVIEGLEAISGESVISMKPIGRIVDYESLQVKCKVLEFDMFKLSEGDSAAIYPLAYPNERILAYVTEINPKVEENGYVSVYLALFEKHDLLDGMSAKVEIFKPELKQILVPKSAVVKKSGRDVVFTVEQSLAKWNYVTIGKENGEQVTILKGLDADKEVIISNNLQLDHDSPVLANPLNTSP